MAHDIIYIGTKAHVVAVDKATGATIWKTKLKGGLASGESFVSLLVQDGRVFAHTYGELFCLDQATGAVIWKNPLDGLGYGLATLGCDGVVAASAQSVAAIQRNKSGDDLSTNLIISSTAN